MILFLDWDVIKTEKAAELDQIYTSPLVARTFVKSLHYLSSKSSHKSRNV